jgi:hypothetical protein
LAKFVKLENLRRFFPNRYGFPKPRTLTEASAPVGLQREHAERRRSGGAMAHG